MPRVAGRGCKLVVARDEPVDGAERGFGNEGERGMTVHERPFDGRMVHERDVARSAACEPIEHAGENRAVERVEEIDHERPARERVVGGVVAHEPDVATAQRRARDRREIVPCDGVQRGRDLDADDLPERAARGEQYGAAHARAEVDERGVLERERHVREQRVEIADRRRFVMRRMRDTRPDRFGVQFAEKEQRLGRDVAVGVEPLSRAPAGNAHL
ncbi:MAG: hypothetical protein NVSMB19_17970 [Vulcanimicrobiaceae bacterium]